MIKWLSANYAWFFSGLGVLLLSLLLDWFRRKKSGNSSTKISASSSASSVDNAGNVVSSTMAGRDVNISHYHAPVTSATGNKSSKGFIGAFVALVIIFVGLAVYKGRQTKYPSDTGARIRITDVILVPMSQSGAAFPALNIYYDNAGPGTASGIVSRFAAGFGGSLSDEDTLAQQDKLLHWDGWKSAMDRRRQFEMHPGDSGEFTSIPNMEGVLASQFRENLDKVNAGTTVLHIFITYKFYDSSGKVGVTENCYWFSGGFARHDCGRGRTFLE